MDKQEQGKKQGTEQAERAELIAYAQAWNTIKRAGNPDGSQFTYTTTPNRTVFDLANGLGGLKYGK